MGTSVLGNSSYRVLWAQTVKDAIKQMLADAQSPEQRQKVAWAAKQLDQGLRRNPLDVGEVYRVRGNVVEHLAALDPLSIEFAVDTQRKLVLVRHAYVMGGPTS